MKEIKEILLLPRRSHFCYFCYFCGTLLSHADSILLSHGKNGKNGNLYSALRSLSAISAISAGHYYLMRIVFLLSHGHRLCRFARRRNEGNKGNSLAPSAKPFLLFLLFLWDIFISCGKFFPAEIKEIAEIIVTDPREVLSALSVWRLLSLADSILLSHGNKGNSSIGCCLRSAFGLKTSGSGTPET